MKPKGSYRMSHGALAPQGMALHLTRSMPVTQDGSGIYEFLANTVGKITGEAGLTLPGSNYCGPLNSISEDYQRRNPPRNRIDSICRDHDLDYNDAMQAKTKGDEQTYGAKIREADEKMVNRIDAITDKSFGEKILGGIAGTAIKGKMKLDSITGNGIVVSGRKKSAIIVDRLLRSS